MEKRGAPKARYVGELYFQAHRGTFTSQAQTKRLNRRASWRCARLSCGASRPPA
jgi:alpha-mannosidase